VTTDDDFGFEPLPWPAVGEKLFVDDAPDWHNNASLHDMGASWRRYAEGYRRGAALLVEYVNKGNRDQDFLVFPIVFCYRQYLELQMKHLVLEGSRLLDLDEELQKSHNLAQLWRTCRSILERVAPDEPKEQLDAVTEGIEQLSAIDPLSDTFRYPVDRKGAPSLPEGAPQIFNLSHFSAQVEKLGNLLNGASEQISVYLDYKHEMAQEYGPGPDDYY
jgi:hypothetical protein